MAPPTVECVPYLVWGSHLYVVSMCQIRTFVTNKMLSYCGTRRRRLIIIKKQCKQTHEKDCEDIKVGLLDLLLLDDRVGGVCIMAGVSNSVPRGPLSCMF